MTTSTTYSPPSLASLTGPDRFEIQWDAYSRKWDAADFYRKFEHLGDEWGTDQYVGWVLENFALPYLTGGEVLELGPGGGRYTAHLVERCERLFGVDVSSQMLARLSRRFQGQSNLVYWKNDGFTLAGIAGESIDFGFSWNVFLQLPIEVVFGYLKEWRRVLRPGARAAFNYAELGHESGWRHFADQYAAWARQPTRPGRFGYLTLGTMDVLCQKAGLQVERNQYANRDAVVIVRKPGPGELCSAPPASASTRRNWVQLDGYLDELAIDVYHEAATEWHTEAARETAESMLLPLEIESALELGAGTAPTLDVLRANGKQTSAVSIGAEPCEHPVLHADMHFTGLADESFDLVVARHVVEHSPMPLLLLMEMARLARRYALVVVPCDEDIWIEWRNHYSVFSRAMWRKLFDRAGWRIVQEQDGLLVPDSTEWRFLLEKKSWPSAGADQTES
ncbi:MAG: class I SAM-dependent methyltransferase [Planctomycetota bacterium]